MISHHRQLRYRYRCTEILAGITTVAVSESALFTLADIQAQARCEYAFFFGTKCDSPIYAASNKVFGDCQLVNLE